MKGVLLAGGTGTRLSPATKAVNKHLLPVYNKPMIYYPLSTLMLAGLRHVVIVSDDKGLDGIRALLGDGSRLGMELEYVHQEEPGGIAHGLLSCAEKIADQATMVMLGDNILHGQGLGRHLARAASRVCGAKIYVAQVAEARDYGVVTVTRDGGVGTIEEKPQVAGPGLAVVGMYFFGPDLLDVIDQLTPSARGELEITDALNEYLASGLLECEALPRGTFWLDLGSPEALFRGSEYVRLVEGRSGYCVGCPEEAAWRLGWISASQLDDVSHAEYHSAYAVTLRSLKS